MTTRRKFFASIFATLVTAPLIRLGWMRAPYRGPYLTPRAFANITLTELHKSFAVSGRKIGDTIKVRKPERFLVSRA